MLLSWAAILAIGIYVYHPPKPLPESAPFDQFSAARADKILEMLVGDSIPHPAGSPQNEIVRNRIVSLLESFGYEVEIQSGTGEVVFQAKDRSPDQDFVVLHNIIARRAGTRSGKAIMLVSHYDSSPRGPGACDDGVGTAAILEIARMLALAPDPEHDVVFLITDGEEFGMLGARLFVDQNPIAKDIGIAINLEARGSAGPSCMFETSQMSRLLVPVFARSTRKKFASSLFYEIYKNLPNDTDFSVLRKHGILGYNFAFIGDVKNYHTPADNFENADRGSLQHHGENALGLVRELQSWDEFDRLFSADDRTSDDMREQTPVNEAVYFDVMGQWIVWWPSHWSRWLSYAAIIGFALSAWRFSRTNSDDENESKNAIGRLIAHLAFYLSAIVSVLVVGYLIQFAVRQDPRLSNPWPLQPVPILLGYWLAGFATVGALALTFSKWLHPRSMWNAFCVIWLILAVTSSVLATGASHLFIAPLIFTSAFAAIACWTGPRGLIATIVVTAIALGFLWLPMERLFYDAVGFKMPLVMMARIAMVSTTLLTLLSITNSRIRFAFAISMSVLAVGSFVAAIFLNGIG